MARLCHLRGLLLWLLIFLSFLAIDFWFNPAPIFFRYNLTYSVCLIIPFIWLFIWSFLNKWKSFKRLVSSPNIYLQAFTNILILAMMIDCFVTLAGEPEIYWSKTYSAHRESNLLAAYFLAKNPLIFSLLFPCYVTFMIIFIRKLWIDLSKYNLLIRLVKNLSHYFCGGWIAGEFLAVKLFKYLQYRITGYLGFTLAIGLFFGHITAGTSWVEDWLATNLHWDYSVIFTFFVQGYFILLAMFCGLIFIKTITNSIKP